LDFDPHTQAFTVDWVEPIILAISAHAGVPYSCFAELADLTHLYLKSAPPEHRTRYPFFDGLHCWSETGQIELSIFCGDKWSTNCFIAKFRLICQPSHTDGRALRERGDPCSILYFYLQLTQLSSAPPCHHDAQVIGNTTSLWGDVVPRSSCSGHSDWTWWERLGRSGIFPPMLPLWYFVIRGGWLSL